MNIELLKHAKVYIDKMANGINPLTDEAVKEDDLLNNIRIARCLFYVSNVLTDVISNNKYNSKKINKIPFYLEEQIVQKYDYSDEYLSVSKVVSRINRLKQDDNMSNLKATDVCSWLLNIGLLKEIENNGKKVKIPTDTGRSIGMILEHRKTAYTEYDIVLYNREAQEFIINNFQNLQEFLNHDKQEII